MSEEEWYFTADGTPFCVIPIQFPMRCRIPVLPDGDGADTAPLAERTARCHHETTVLVGSAPTCGHHLEVMFRIAGTKPRQPIAVCP